MIIMKRFTYRGTRAKAAAAGALTRADDAGPTDEGTTKADPSRGRAARSSDRLSIFLDRSIGALICVLVLWDWGGDQIWFVRTVTDDDDVAL